METDPVTTAHAIATDYAWISSLAFSPDGRILASGGAQPNTGILWDAATGQNLLALPPHVAPVRAVVFSPDGTLIACASGNFDPHSVMPNEIILSEVDTGRAVATLGSDREPFTALAFSADGIFLASGALAPQNAVRIWHMATKSPTAPLEGYASDVLSVAFSPAGGRVAAGCRDGTLRVWDSATGAQVLTWDNRAGAVYSIAWSPDGTHLAAGGDERAHIALWDVRTGDEVRTIAAPLYHTIFSLAFSPDGHTLIGGLGQDHDKTGAVILWDMATGQERRTLFSTIEAPDATDGVIYAVAITKDGRTVAAGGGDGTIFVWNVDR